MFEYKATIAKVTDGDTLRVNIDLGFGIWKMNEVLRLAGIDAPELDTAAGQAARARLLELMPPGSPVRIQTVKDKREKYGRYLATVFPADGEHSINDQLVAEGHAVTNVMANDSSADTARKTP